MTRRSRARRSSRAGNWGVVLVCLLLVGFGIYTIVRGVHAIDQGTMVPGGPRTGPMSGTTALIMGASAVLAGGFGLWLLGRVRRKRLAKSRSRMRGGN